MARSIAGKTVVVTGASSGIGRATALEFASKGANVVAVARREEPLGSLVQECEKGGGHALAVVADVTDAAALQNVADAARARFGRLDVWVNNASVMAFGFFDDTPPEVARRLVETNLVAYIEGTRIALDHFRQQDVPPDDAGMVINVASVDGKVGSAYQAVYSATKFGVVGFDESLRQELTLQKSPIRVCTVIPASIATPLYQHAANYAGQGVKPLNPSYSAETVAKAIVACAERPKNEVFAGGAGIAMDAMRHLAPPLYSRMFAAQVSRDLFTGQPSMRHAGNVFEPMREGTDTSGGWEATSPRMMSGAMIAAGVAALSTLFAVRILRR